MNTCKTCEHRNASGNCECEKLAEDYGFSEEEKKDMLVYSYTEGGGFWVGDNFGCIHHTSNA